LEIFGFGKAHGSLIKRLLKSKKNSC